MKPRIGILQNWRNALWGAVLSLVVGLFLVRWGHGLVFLSYDLLFLIKQAGSPEEVVIVYMDDKSHAELGQTNAVAWDRNLHAQLINRMTALGAKQVVFDVVFDLPGTPSANTNFARAMEENGNVVLAAALNPEARPQVQVRSPDLPLPELLRAAAGWGVAESMSAEKDVVRKYWVGTTSQPSLPWKAAQLAGAEITREREESELHYWLNFYGPPLSLKHVRYSEALQDLPSHYFRDKTVFVGYRPTTLLPGDEADAFPVPQSFWKHEYMPGVEIAATAFLNFLHQEGLVMMSFPNQLWLVIIAGIVFGGVIGLFRVNWAVGGSVVSILAIIFAAFEVAKHQVWFPWTVVAFAQIPVALAWSLRCHFHRLKFDKEVLERTLKETTRHIEEASATRVEETGLSIPDHELIRCVGRGAYGEVWLARNAVGVFHAVKIIQRRAFPSEGPYEREFKGIQKFMPISRSHQGFVNVLHVGRNDHAGYFFCIMESADDQTTGSQLDPENYSPKSLQTVLTSRGVLPPEECVQLGIDLCSALEHLHRQNLIHRDIKPGNIIYVNGAPKFADIGLVTEQRSEEKFVSFVGTEGYVPPEGPGSPSADVFALGKVLYEACMGRDRLMFPEVPTALWEAEEDSVLRRLNEIIGKACASDPGDRFATAGELGEALRGLLGRGE